MARDSTVYFRASRVIARRRESEGSTDIDKRSSPHRGHGNQATVARPFLFENEILTSSNVKQGVVLCIVASKLVFVAGSESHADSLHYTLQGGDAPQLASEKLLIGEPTKFSRGQVRYWHVVRD